MSLIANYGPESSPIWIIVDEPYGKEATYKDVNGVKVIDDESTGDAKQGTLFSGGTGYVFRKLWKLAGLDSSIIHIRSLCPCIGASYADITVQNSQLLLEIDKYHPTFIIPMSDQLLNYLCPETTQHKEKNSSLRKWAGSLLQSKYISYPHYVIGNYPPDWVIKQWDYNEIQAFIDFGHVKEEFDYWKQYGTINKLPIRHILTEPSFGDIISYLNDCLSLPIISHDIETIRPKKGTFYSGDAPELNNGKKHPGFLYSIAIAKSKSDAISFCLWDYKPEQIVKIVRLLDELFTKVPQIGQNYFLFDSHYMEAHGFNLRLSDCKDTLIRHHILWPGLRHSLQFQTKQYTRQPFYKDEGRNFNIKQKKKFLNYGGLDACVTYEVFEEQEKEFDERPHLK